MSRTLQQIIDEPDYGVLDHSEILQLIEYMCEQAVSSEVNTAVEHEMNTRASANQTSFEAIMQDYADRLATQNSFTVTNPFILPGDNNGEE